MNIAVYPGSFDPITNGHIDIINRGSKVFDKVIVGILVNIDKQYLFNINERVELVKKVTKDLKNVEVVSFDGLLVNFLHEHNVTTVLKGLRTTSDFEYEMQMDFFNKKLNSNIEIMYMMSSIENLHISSSSIKQIAKFGGSIKEFVPKEIVSDIVERINS